MKIQLFAALGIVSSLSFAQDKKAEASILSADLQTKIALLAAPENVRGDAKVLGYNPKGEIVELKKGTSNFTCLAPDYKMPNYYASYCYPNSLEPLMARGRELIKEGKRRQRNDIRAQEFAEGKFTMPTEPTTMYGYWGTLEQLNKETGEMADAKRRYVIYVSGKKASDLGLSNQPNNIGMPWLMDEGTYKAHIMITPPMEHNH
jgi:hypothetical protein